MLSRLLGIALKLSLIYIVSYAQETTSFSSRLAFNRHLYYNHLRSREQTLRVACKAPSMGTPRDTFVESQPSTSCSLLLKPQT